MDNRNNFEEHIKAKLEEIAAVDTDKAWQGFAPLLTKQHVPFWKHWLLPYAYATLLFCAGLAYLGWTGSGFAENGGSSDLGFAKTDTLVRRDTIYLVDTIYVVKKVYVAESHSLASGRSAWNRDVSTIGPSNGLAYQSPGDDFPIADADDSKAGNEPVFAGEKVSRNRDQEGSDVLGVSEGAENPSQATSQGMSAQLQGNPTSSPIAGNPSPRTISAPSLAPREELVMKVDKELVIGDTSNLRMPPQKAKMKPMFHLEAGASVLFPISRLVEYYTPVQPGLMAGLEWENGWGLYTGAIRSRIEGEIDDEEIALLDPSKVRSFPNVPQDIDALDEIYFVNRQWFFPLEARWRSLYYSGFSFESNFGIMANYLYRQEFTYEFENFSMQEYAYGTSSLREFGISHLRVGIGTSYLHSKRLGFYLRSQYWFPLSGKGLLHDRMHGLEVGGGINLFIGK